MRSAMTPRTKSNLTNRECLRPGLGLGMARLELRIVLGLGGHGIDFELALNIPGFAQCCRYHGR